jgi:hypothetical protein
MEVRPEQRSVKGINEVDEYHFHVAGNEDGEPIFFHHGVPSHLIDLSCLI